MTNEERYNKYVELSEARKRSLRKCCTEDLAYLEKYISRDEYYSYVSMLFDRALALHHSITGSEMSAEQFVTMRDQNKTEKK